VPCCDECARAHTLDALTAYGEHIGLAFQIADDILDVVGDEAAIGKPVGSDDRERESDLSGALGLDQSRVLAREAADAADCRACAASGRRRTSSGALADFIVDRDR
jgi:geranylgeranyl diphosphate synthase type II